MAIRSQKKWGAPTAVDLDTFVREPADKRERWLQDRAGENVQRSFEVRITRVTTINGFAGLGTLDSLRTLVGGRFSLVDQQSLLSAAQTITLTVPG